MCEAVREYGDEREARGKAEGKVEGKVETITQLLEMGMPLEQALKATEIDEKTYREYMDKYADEE